MSETIKRLIHHEKQEKGSMLCAQHALNAILQGNYFAASDLSEIARELDELEAQYRDRDAAPNASVNMDDSGFFSVQVMDKALLVWGLTLVRWRSQELARFHDNPDTQQAFVLNLNQHWFTMRRFGQPGGNGHWFNLNSSFEYPERVGEMYLGMVLQQAEAEGYSVFSVRPLPGAEASVPPCEADEVASTIAESELQSFAEQTGHSNVQSASRSVGAPASSDAHGIDDDDVEFQRALEMSLSDTGGIHASGNSLGLVERFSGQPTASASSSRLFLPHSSLSVRAPGASGSISPAGSAEERVQASDVRSKARLEQFQREQQMAEQEGGFGRARRKADEDEDEELRRAIKESLKSSDPNVPLENNGDDDDDEDYILNSGEDSDPDESHVPLERRTTRRAISPTQLETQPAPGVSRIIDDEDAELQAALKASLEELPEGFVPPATPPRQSVHVSQPPVHSREQPSRPAPVVPSDDEAEDAPQDSGKGKAREESPEVEKLDVDEMRRRRLARFGGSY